MKTKISSMSSILILLLMGILCFCGTSSSLENRTLATFEMVLNPNSDSVVYSDTALERFEAAMKDQFILRPFAIETFLRMNKNTLRIFLKDYCQIEVEMELVALIQPSEIML